MIKFAVTLSTGLRTEIWFEDGEIPEKEAFLSGTYKVHPDRWFADRVRGGRQFTDIHGWTIVAEHIVMFKRLED